MSSRKELRVEPFCFRLAQRRSPLIISAPQGGAPYRPFITLLVDETRSLVLGSRVSEQRLNHGEMSQWILETLHKPSASYLPQVIQVEDKALREALRFVFRGQEVEIRLNRGGDFVDRVIDQLEQEMGELQGPCLVKSLGPELTRDLFRAAAGFVAQQPWSLVDSGSLIQVTVPNQSLPWAALVLGSAGEEFGLVLYDSIEAGQRAREGISARCTAAMNLSSEAFLCARDHQLLDGLVLDFPPQRLPWILGDMMTREGLSPDTARHLLWALRHVPEFLKRNTPIHRDGYGLAWIEAWDGVSPELAAFTARWRRKGRSARAKEMAGYFMLFLEALQLREKCQPAELEEHRRNCHRAGWMVLHESRRAFDAGVFLHPPRHRAQFRKDVSAEAADWNSYCRTWRMLGDFRQAPEEPAPAPPTVSANVEALEYGPMELLQAWMDFRTSQGRGKARAMERLNLARQEMRDFLLPLPSAAQRQIKEEWVEKAGQMVVVAEALPVPGAREMARKMMDGFAELVTSL